MQLNHKLALAPYMSVHYYYYGANKNVWWLLWWDSNCPGRVQTAGWSQWNTISMRETPMWCRESPRKNPEDPQSCSGDVRRRSSSSCSALEMKTFTRVYLSWSLLTVAVLPWSSGEMYTSLLNVKEAISVERKLIDYLRTYIDHELQRLQDVRRWVSCTMEAQDL